MMTLHITVHLILQFMVCKNILRKKLTLTLDEDGDDHAVHTEHTSHNNGNDRLEDQFTLQDGDGDDTDTRLGSSVGGAQVSENEGRDDSHDTKEHALVGVSESCYKGSQGEMHLV